MVGVAIHELDEPAASFDAAVAVVTLHHVEPLDESCRRLAKVLRPGAELLVDELDVARLDVRAATWWLEQQRALGRSEQRGEDELVADLRAHLHPLARIDEALRPDFDLGLPLRGAYLYRWELNEPARAAEEELIAQGRLPAVGARLLARRRA